MTRHTIPYGNWHTALADTIENAADGDVIVVHNEVMKELAIMARAHMCPKKRLSFEIAPTEEWTE